MSVERVTIRIPGEWVELLEKLARREGYASRSELVRSIIRNYLKKRGVLREDSIL